MRNKKVVIIRSNPVNPDSRVEKEALTLFEAGYDVTVLCWDRDCTHKAKNDFLVFQNCKIPVVRLGFKASYGEGFKNIVPFLRFQFSMRRWLKKNKTQFDIVHACDFDTAFFSIGIARRLKKKFIFDIFDFLYGEPRGLLQKAVKNKQISIINRADATIICTEERKEQISGSNPKRLFVIHNSPSAEQLTSSPKRYERNNDKPRVCYVGILQDGRLLREIGSYFSQNPNIELHIGGFGYLDSYFSELSKKNNNIFFYGRMPYNKTLELEYNSDILLAIYDPAVENHRFAAPNKFYESLFLGKPVLMVRDTGMSDVVETNDIGALIDFSFEGFKSGIESLVSKKTNWVSIGERARKLYDSLYSWETMKKRLINLYSCLFDGE